MCTSPLLAWRLPSGSIRFGGGEGVGIPLSLPCGRCIECRLERSRQSAVRCLHESKMHADNCFITLTYNDDNYPSDGNLDYRHFQLFLKRFRKSVGPVRFYMCGEYGTETGRAHYHAILFGYYPADAKYYKKGKDGNYYNSAILDKLWGMGNVIVTHFTFETAAYVTRYITTKLLGDAVKHVERNGRKFVINLETGEEYVPEFNHMSLKPGIGASYYRKWSSDIYPHDRVVVRGKACKPPRYYDKLYAIDNPLVFRHLRQARIDSIKLDDNTVERLRARSIVNQAKYALLKRKEI